jgi:signal transduction histidine kinase
MALIDGTMGADSTPGVGSIFWIELNLEGTHHD